MFRSSLVDYRTPKREEAYVDAPYFPADTFSYTKAEREEMRRRALEEQWRRQQQLGGQDWQPPGFDR
jgi:hypothetical protein